MDIVKRMLQIIDQVQTFYAKGLSQGSAPFIAETPEFTIITAKENISTVVQTEYKASSDSGSYFYIPSAEAFGSSFNKSSTIVVKVIVNQYLVVVVLLKITVIDS